MEKETNRFEVIQYMMSQLMYQLSSMIPSVFTKKKVGEHTQNFFIAGFNLFMQRLGAPLITVVDVSKDM